MTSALVYGLAVAGESVARALRARGVDVVVADDAVTPERRAVAEEIGAEFVGQPDNATIETLVRRSDLVCPSPGVPETHRVVEAALAAGADLVSEIELAYRWEQERNHPRPMLAVTGTDGKTTTTLLTVAMLEAAGLRSVDAGNTSTPLVDAIGRDLDAFVVECTSFRLAWTPSFRAEAAAWLNLAPDHLNWHRSMDTYESAKGRIFCNQRAGDTSIGFVDDPVVMEHLRRSTARRRSFGLVGADYRVRNGELTGPAGTIAPVESMRRRLPHDITNALAASALVLESGLGDVAAIESALADFVGPEHRLESVGAWNDIEWFNDSKATTPHAARAAIAGFDRVVLIAGGYDKGVDLAPMAVDRDRITALVAVGDTAESVAAAFEGVPVIERAELLDDAVRLAAGHARPGEVVLLSPGCASFDQYRGFEERGDHFRRLVLDLHREGSR
jgi:UDP-N-acetylmuramoylalanine--D-glutamate ligase